MHSRNQGVRRRKGTHRGLCCPWWQPGGVSTEISEQTLGCLPVGSVPDGYLLSFNAGRERSWASRALAHGGESAVLTDSVSHSASLHPRGHWLAWQACRRLGYRMGADARAPCPEAVPPPTAPAASPLRGERRRAFPKGLRAKAEESVGEELSGPQGHGSSEPGPR